MNKTDFEFNLIFIIGPILAVTLAFVLMYQFFYLPAQAEKEQFEKKYPSRCMLERNQTVIQLNANDKVTLYQPETVCQVTLGQFPNDNGTIGYFAQYQYESQAKWNKSWHDVYLNCKPKSFDENIGSFICMNGSVAQEKDIYG